MMQTSSLKHASVLNEFGPFVCSLGDLVHCKASSPIPFCLFVCLFARHVFVDLVVCRFPVETAAAVTRPVPDGTQLVDSAGGAEQT